MLMGALLFVRTPSVQVNVSSQAWPVGGPETPLTIIKKLRYM